ncbi:MAG: hypothetical protein R6X34_20005 [Chloroflexota bacterium]
MAKLTQSQLVRQAEIFVTNGAKPAAQAVIAGVGYEPAVLNDGQDLVSAVKTGQALTKEQLAAQKSATQAEKKARLAAQKETTSLAETSRLLFADDGAALTALGLQTQYVTVTDPVTGKIDQQAAEVRRSTAETISRWRQLVKNATQLQPDQIAALTAAGWGEARVTAVTDLVEAYASADTAQQSAIQTYQQTSAQYKTDIETLRAWYSRARQLCALAIKDKDPGNQQNLRELLGLDG